MYKQPPPHCAICGIELAEAHLSFLWFPMCAAHVTRARGLHTWSQQLCNRVYSEEELLELGKQVVHFMREEEERHY